MKNLNWKKILGTTGMVLGVVAMLNWGLVGAFNFNLVELISFGFERAVYVIVGIFGLIAIPDVVKRLQ